MPDKPLFSPLVKKILIYLQEHVGVDADYKQIAEAIKEDPSRVQGALPHLIRQGYAVYAKREDRNIARLTTAGRAVNPNKRVDAR